MKQNIRCHNIYQNILALALFLCLLIPIYGWTAAPVGTQITNIASLNYADKGGFQYTTPSNLVTVTIGGAPLLTVTKIGHPNPVSAGEELTYTIQYANVGNVPAQDVVLTDMLPDDVTFLSATGGGQEEQGIIIWNIGTLTANESGVVEVKVKVNENLNPGDTIENVVSITDSTDIVVTGPPSTVTVGQAPSLKLKKTASGSTTYPGGNITYTIEYANTGNISATQVRITDQLPIGTTFVSATDGGVENRRIVTWTIESLAPGDTGSVQFTVKAGSGLTEDAIISNIAHISSREGIDALSNQVDVVVKIKPPIEVPSLELKKSASDSTIYPGANITYTIEYANTGNISATQVRITDQLPTGTTFVSATNGGVENQRIVTWTIESLAAGDTGNVQFTVKVDSGLAEGVVISNVAHISSQEGVDALSNQVDVVVKIELVIPAKITLVPDPDTILGDGKHASELTATVVDADGNPLPDGTIVTLTTTRGTFPNGTQEIKVPTKDGVAITHLTAEIVSNTPVETFATATAGTPETGIVEDEVKIIFAPGAIAGIVVSKTREMPIAGAEVTVIDEAGNVIGTDITDADGKYLVFIPKTGDYTVTVKSKDELNREVSFTEEVNVSAVFGAIFEPGNVITGIVFDRKTGNVLKDVTLRLLDDLGNPVLDKNGNPIIVTTDSNGAYMIQGLMPGTYTVEVQESLPGYYRHGSITIRADEEGKFVIDANILIDPYGFVYDASTNQRIEGATVSLFDFNTEELVSLPVYLGEIQLNPETTDANGYYDFFVPPGEYFITATAPGYHDFKSGKIIVTTDVVNLNIPLLPMPQLIFTKASDKLTAMPGDLITYTLTYKNSGGNATNTIITDPIPDNTSFVSASDNGVETDGTVRWTLGILESLMSGSVQLTVRVLPSAPDNSIIENTATIDSDEIVLLSASASTTIQIPALNIKKDVSPKIVEAGERLTYTIDFRNSGSAEATNVEIRDPLPEHTAFVSATGGGSLQSGIVIWNIGTIAPGASRQVKFIAEVDSPLRNGTLITNVATIKSDQTPEMQASVTAEVKSAPILSLEKKVDSPSPGLSLRGRGDDVKPGDVITYILGYNNTGNEVATDVIVSDVLPENLQYVEGGTYDESSRTVQWNIGDLKPNKRFRNVTFKAKVKEDLEPGLYEIQNIATLTSSEVEKIESNPVFTSILVPYIQLTKMGNKRIAEIGDIITYMLTVTNLSPNSDLLDVTVEDILPRGFGYLSETGLVDSQVPINPSVSKNQIVFKIPQILKGKAVTIGYSTSVGANADLGDGINKAQAYGYTPQTRISDTGFRLTSNQTEWQVQVRRGIFAEKGIIMGKVFIDSDDDGVQDKGEEGVPNIALVMEDGTTVITDEDGKYSIPEVDSGLHVLRIDERSLPEDYMLTGRDVQFAGKPHIRFVRVSSPAKADFMLKKLPPKAIEVEIMTPIIVQPTAPMPIPMPRVTVIQPRIMPPPPKPELIVAPIEPVIIAQPSQPVAITAEVVVSQPTTPPEIRIRFEPQRIPAGDPYIIVTSNVELKKVVATHPDAVASKAKQFKQFELKLKDGEWRAHFIVPFDIPDGPYPITVTATDMLDRTWRAVGLITIDNSIISIYAECSPRNIEAGGTINIRVTTLFPAGSVNARMDDGTTIQLHKVKGSYNWAANYTVPANTSRGLHRVRALAIAEDGKHKFTEIATYRVR